MNAEALMEHNTASLARLTPSPRPSPRPKRVSQVTPFSASAAGRAELSGDASATELPFARYGEWLPLLALFEGLNWQTVMPIMGLVVTVVLGTLACAQILALVS